MRGSAALANAMRQQARMSQNDFALPRLATISSYDQSNHSVKVIVQPVDPEVGEQESNWMQLGAIGIGNGWGVAVGPQINDQVLVVYENGDFSSGTIVARVFSVAQQAIAVPSGEVWACHQTGAFLKLTNDGKVNVKDAGGSTLTMNADGTSTLTSNLTINGTLLVTETITGEGGITITGDNGSGNASSVTGNVDFTGTVMANGKHIDNTHIHSNGNGGANTGTPVS